MTKIKAGKHEFLFSGDHVDCVISSINRQKAEEWLKRGAEALFLHTITATEDELNEIENDPAFIGNYRDFRDTVRLEGCELHNGVFDFTNAAGESIECLGMESAEFHNYIDDIIKIDPETHLIDAPTEVVRIRNIEFVSRMAAVESSDDHGSLPVDEMGLRIDFRYVVDVVVKLGALHAKALNRLTCCIGELKYPIMKLTPFETNSITEITVVSDEGRIVF